MRKVEVRVRPVVRHIVTLYESGPLPGTADKYHATLDTLGEFDNEAQAEYVATALRKQAPKPMQYVAVERGFDALTNAVYFDVEEDALEYVGHARSKGREFRVFAREVEDPVARAHHEVGMVSHGFPGGIENVQIPAKPPALSNQYVIVPTSGTKTYHPGLAWTLEEAKEQKSKCEAEYGEPFAIGIFLMPDQPAPQFSTQANGPAA